MALVDSGADFSAVDYELCRTNKWKINPQKGTIALATDGQTTHRIGVTEPLLLENNGRTLTGIFEVLKFSNGTKVSIGTDYMADKGIGMTVLAV